MRFTKGGTLVALWAIGASTQAHQSDQPKKWPDTMQTSEHARERPAAKPSQTWPSPTSEEEDADGVARIAPLVVRHW